MSRASRLPVDVRRDRLLALGLRLFSEHRYDDVTTDAIARAAGVSKGLLYHYFANKREYYVAAISELGRRLLDATRFDARVSFTEAVRSALFRFIDFVRQNAAAYRALCRGGVGQDDEVAAIVARVREASIAAVLDRGAIASPSPRLRAALHGWTGYCEAVSLYWIAQGCEIVDEDLVDTLLAALVATLSGGSDRDALLH